MRTLVSLGFLIAAAISAGCESDAAMFGDTPDRSIAPTSAAVDPSTSQGSTDTSLLASADSAPTTGANCLVRLHGKGGDGQPSQAAGEVVEVAPSGNGEGWGARQWLYASETDYATARAAVAAALDNANCARAVVNGFSNGASFGVALYCRGESFEQRVIGYVIDDPVPDQAAVDCTPQATTELVLYWTGALEGSTQPGAQCADVDFTCAGSTFLGIIAYAEALGTPIVKSPLMDHEWFRNAPEIERWLIG